MKLWRRAAEHRGGCLDPLATFRRKNDVCPLGLFPGTQRCFLQERTGVAVPVRVDSGVTVRLPYYTMRRKDELIQELEQVAQSMVQGSLSESAAISPARARTIRAAVTARICISGTTLMAVCVPCMCHPRRARRSEAPTMPGGNSRNSALRSRRTTASSSCAHLSIRSSPPARPVYGGRVE